jgi:predicted RNA-binding protein (virulence factor B family)
MIEIGKYNQLKYTEKVGMGIILSDGEESAILPYGYVPDDFNPGDLIDVFVYSQADGLLFATTQTAIACVESGH